MSKRPKRLRRFLSALLAIVVLLSTTGAAFAAEPPTSDSPPITDEENSIIDSDVSATELDAYISTGPNGENVLSGAPVDSADLVQDSTTVPAQFFSGALLAPRFNASPTNTDIPQTSQEATARLTALRAQYPEGMAWTNDTPYGSKGNLGDSYHPNQPVKISDHYITSSRGCSALVFKFQDTMFGNLPQIVRYRGQFDYDDVHAGDHLRLYGNSHSVIVWQVTPAGCIVIEANYNGTVHWGRVISKAEVEDATYLVTRWPQGLPNDTGTGETIVEGGEGKVGDLSWKVTQSGLLTIQGTGPMPNYTTVDSAPWAEFNYHTVVIADGVTSIGNCAFRDNDLNTDAKSNLVEVRIPGTVKTIGYDAFRNCRKLISASLPDGIQEIGDNAFRGCTSLKSVDLPGSITKLGDGAFMSCELLTTVIFANSNPGVILTTVGDNLFSQCWNIRIVILPSNLPRISAGMFQSCTVLGTLHIPKSIKSIENNAFSSSGVYKIYFEGSKADWLNASPAGAFPSLGLSMGGSARSLDQAIANEEIVLNQPYVNPFATDSSDLIEDPEEDPCKDGHDWTDANGICKTCGTACAHDWDLETNVCNICHKPTSQEPPIDPVPSDHQHSWAATWSYDESAHWHECVADGECPITENINKSDYALHSYGDWVIDVNATATQDGSKHQDCTVCEYRQTAAIPATGSSGTDPIIPVVPTPVPTNPPNPTPIPTPVPTSPSNPTSAPTQDPDDSGTSVIIDPETGVKTETTENPDGSITTIITQPDQTVTTITTDPAGNIATTVQLSTTLIDSANQQNTPVALPIAPVPVAANVASASTITITTADGASAQVSIPVDHLTISTVIAIVNPDGTAKIIPSSVPNTDSIITSLPSGTTVKIIDNQKTYHDVSTAAWSNRAVTFTSARGLFAGTSTATFSPKQPMTRAMLMTVLARYAGANTGGGSTWYEKSVEWAKANGISDGKNPNSNITREQLVTMLWRCAGSPTPNGDLSRFSDIGMISGYAQKAMRWAVDNGIVSGFGDGRLGPKQQATRAEAAQMLMNLIMQ